MAILGFTTRDRAEAAPMTETTSCESRLAHSRRFEARRGTAHP